MRVNTAWLAARFTSRMRTNNLPAVNPSFRLVRFCFILSTYVGRAFAYPGLTSWNSLADNPKNVNLSLQTFKRHLKTFFFCSYYHYYYYLVWIVILFTHMCTCLCVKDRSTFRRIVLKNAFNKRKMYEALLESVPMLNTIDVCTTVVVLIIIIIIILFLTPGIFTSWGY